MTHDRTLSFIVLTFTISWGAWGILLPDAHVGASVRTVLFTLGLWGPFLAAFILSLRRTRSPRATLKEIARLRAGLVWYIVAFILPILLYGSVAIVYILAGGQRSVDPAPSLLIYPVMLGASLFAAGGQEEPGWRGFLHPPLQARFGALPAALVVGAVWAVWHLPLLYIPGTPLSRIPLAVFLPAILVFGILLTSVLNGAEAVGPVALMHAQVNALAPWVPVPPKPLWIGLLVASGITAVLILAIYGPERLAPRRAEPVGSQSHKWDWFVGTDSRFFSRR